MRSRRGVPWVLHGAFFIPIGLALLAAALLLPLTAPAAIYTGSWNNTTFGSSGDAFFDIVLTDTTFSLTADLDGPVFGGFDPPALVLAGTREPDGSVILATTHPVFGTVTGTVGATGEVTALLTTAIGTVDVTGSFSDTLLDLVYVVVFTGGAAGGVEGLDFARGTLVASVVPLPPTVLLFATGLLPLTRRLRRTA